MGSGTDTTGTAERLRRIPLLAGVAEEEVARLALLVHSRTFADGEPLCRVGDDGDSLFLVDDGFVEVRRGDRTLARLGPGHVVGELAVIDGQPRSADVVAAGPVRILELEGSDFRSLLESSGALAASLVRVLAGRVREERALQERVDQLVRAFRERGHVLAELDPLGLRRPGSHPELTLGFHGLAETDLDRLVTVTLGRSNASRTLREVLSELRAAYCTALAVQYLHVDDLEVQRWLRERLEGAERDREPSRDEQLRILTRLTDAWAFEHVLQSEFGDRKRFSLEGAETLVPLLDQAIEQAAARGVEHVVIGMPHRGRLNVAASVLGKPPHRIFRELADADERDVPGDVTHHLGFEAVRRLASGGSIRLALCFNPSHLEFVSPVVVGRTRALQDRLGDARGDRVLPVVVHGDAAFAGQGIVQELFNLSELEGYASGGALHVVLNNQIGFTTPPEDGRSTQYATDVARMLQVPIFHVNGERPEAVDRAVRLALEFRQRFHRDVVIDMYCYRRRGHSERDDPAVTQPLLYREIADRDPIHATYATNLLRLGDVTSEEATGLAARSLATLREELSASSEFEPPDESTTETASRHLQAGASAASTAVESGRSSRLLERLSHVPAGFTPHPRVKALLAARRAMARGSRRVDWGTAEALAHATLLEDGISVRLSGQDSARGTFGQRHAVLHDAETGECHVPLEAFVMRGARYSVFNSPLSEAGVLGFDYGYSLDAPDALVVWEAQFGDFSNAAQVIIDQFITSGEAKWRQRSGLTLLLPHGLEGDGPEHSSARVERWLQLACGDDLKVLQPSTAAQLFHCLRAQGRDAPRRPLVILTPKATLQHPSVASPLDAFAAGGFRPVLRDADAQSDRVRHVVFCTGKLGAELARERGDDGSVAIVRVEQLHPFPAAEAAAALEALPAARRLTWAQEEPENMGAWSALSPRLAALPGVGRRLELRCVARPASASPAAGSRSAHVAQQRRLIDELLG